MCGDMNANTTRGRVSFWLRRYDVNDLAVPSNGASWPSDAE